MQTVDTGTGHEGIIWDATLHDLQSIEYSNSEAQMQSTSKTTDTENTTVIKKGDGQSTNYNPRTIRTNVSDNSVDCIRNQHKEMVAEVENPDNDKVWPLMEIQYGVKSMNLPSTRETGETRRSMNLLNETPVQLNGDPREKDLEDRRERHNVCTIL